MERRTFGRRAMAALVVVAGIESPAGAQQPAPRPAQPEAAKLPTRDDLIKDAEAFIKPLPLEPIPDDPPPHEGAMIELSYRVEPPDIDPRGSPRGATGSADHRGEAREA